MKTIKKVAVTPIQENTGVIIDSFNTSDNKHTNAPSINAVEQKVSTVQTATVTATKSNIDFTLNFKRNMNIVTLNVSMFIPSTVDSVVNWLTSSDFTIPEWAKTSDNTVTNLDGQNITEGSSTSNGLVAFSSVGQVILFRQSSSDYRLAYQYLQANSGSYPDGHTIIANLKYIVTD